MAIRRGFLSDHFRGVAVKRLSAVEANILRSNQHEFNSSKQFRSLLGQPQRQVYPAKLIWIGGEQEGLTDEVELTWYESRKPPRSEHRLYFPANTVCAMASEGDFLFLAKRTDGSLLAIITPVGGTVQNQLLWLFALEQQIGLDVESQDISGSNDAELDFAARYILDELGIEPEEQEADKLDRLVKKFGLKFPTTIVFSALARSSLPEVSARDDPDQALLLWMEREEQLFRRLERRIVAERIQTGFTNEDGADVDGFIKFSLSVQNTRKSRAGLALENHLAAIFDAYEIRFGHGVETENRNRPDFLFPGRTEYLDMNFPADRLTMLGAKSTLKDRWRQVLSEAVRVEEKHLLTLEPGISENQTDEMRVKLLQLVVPRRLHATFKPVQQSWLMDVASFITTVAGRQ